MRQNDPSKAFGYNQNYYKKLQDATQLSIRSFWIQPHSLCHPTRHETKAFGYNQTHYKQLQDATQLSIRSSGVG